jgi:hypothetical protein
MTDTLVTKFFYKDLLVDDVLFYFDYKNGL